MDLLDAAWLSWAQPVLLCVILMCLLVYVYGGNVTKVQDGLDMQDIPGPAKSHPKLGNLLDVERAGGLHHYLHQLHAQYGSIVKVWFEDRAFVSTASPELFKGQVKLYDKPGMQWVVPVFGDKILQFQNGEAAKERRRNYDAFFSRQEVRKHFPTFLQLSNQIAETLDDLEPGADVNIYDYNFLMTCRSMGITMFGEFFRNNENITRFKTLYDHYWPVLEKNFTIGLPDEGSLERAEIDKTVVKVHHFLDDLIKYHTAHDVDRKFIDIILETGEDQMTIYGDILVYVTALTWCLYHAARYPATQDRLYEEVKRVVGNDQLKPDQLAQLKYLRQFIEETLRLRFIAPAAIRLADRNTKLGPYHIPEQTNIIQALGVIMNNEQLWEHPDRFDPDRFARNERGLYKNKQPPLAYCPFGFAGRRLCPGKTFFYDEAMVYLAVLVSRFEFELSKKTSRDIPINNGLLTRPDEDVFLKVKKRR